MLVHTMNPHGILMLNLSISKNMQGQTYRIFRSWPLFGDEEYSVHCPYDLVDNKVNTIYIVYKIRDYYSTGIEHNYLFSCGMSDNHRGICFLKDEKTMRVHGVAGKPHYMDISNFPTRYFNPCRRNKWNFVCVVYDTTSGKSSLWVNHGKIRDYACRLPLIATLNLFNRVVHFDDASGFDGYIESVGRIAARMTYLCEKFKIPKRADGN